MPDLTGLVHAGTVGADTGSCVPTRNDPPLVSSTTKTLLSGAPGQGQGSSPHSPHTHTNVPQYHQAQHAPMEPNTQALPLFLPFSASLNLSGESVYLQSMGIVQLLRKCTKCFLLSSAEPFPSTVESGNCTDSPFAHHSRCQRGFALHA